MVAVQTILPEGSLQEGIVSYPGHQHPPAIRAARNSFLRQANTCQATSQFLHQFAVFPNIIPAGLTALAVAKFSLKGANLFLGKYSKKTADPHWWSEQKQVCPQQAPAGPDRAAQ